MGRTQKKVTSLQGDLGLFQSCFVDRSGFKEFADNLYDRVGSMAEIDITGYFSETIRETLERIVKIPVRVRIICPFFIIKGPRDRKNLEALEKLRQTGAEVKVNDRLHARFLVGYTHGQKETRGLLLIGSFDFNTECIGKDRYDAGIFTTHPDLVTSATQLFEEIWNEQGSFPLQRRYRTEMEKILAFAPGPPSIEKHLIAPKPLAPPMEKQPRTQNTSIGVVPQSVSVDINSVFKVEITVSKIPSPGIYSYQLQVQFNNVQLEATNVEILNDHFLKPTSPLNIFILDPGTINNADGIVSLAMTLLGSEKGKTGNGTLCRVTFRGKAKGKSKLLLRDVILVDSNTQSIPPQVFGINDGDVVVGDKA